MKKASLLPLFLLSLGLWAQSQDSAAVVVGRYLKILNYEALPQDSTLVLETTITFHGSNDTFSLRRWFTPPAMMRVEVWHRDTLTDGYCTNGSDRHRGFQRHMGWWNDIPHSDFHHKIDAYEFRGPLYNWEQRGVKLTYQGIATAKGQRLQVVRAELEGSYARYYFFEEQSGLLVLVQEKDEDNAEGEAQIIKKLLRVKPIDYKVYHEYLPLGTSLVPLQESYMRDGVLTIMETTARFVPRNNMIFNQD